MSKYQRLPQAYDEHTTAALLTTTTTAATTTTFNTPANTTTTTTVAATKATTCDNREQFSKFFTLTDDDGDDVGSDAALAVAAAYRVRNNQNVNHRYETSAPTAAVTTAPPPPSSSTSSSSTSPMRIITRGNATTIAPPQTMTTIAMLDSTLDENNTMEVPLLNCDNQHYDHPQQQHHQHHKHRHSHKNNNNNRHYNNYNNNKQAEAVVGFNIHNDDYNDDDDADDDDDDDNAYTLCHTKQAGFGAKLMDKTTREAKTKIIIAILMCVVFMIVEFLGGYFAGSLAIMTDAAHLASDCITFIIGLVSLWLGTRPPDARMSFGYKRVEVLGAVASIMGIWILTATLVIVAIQRICLNDYDLDAETMMIISGIGILINVAMIFVLHGSILGHGHSHSHSHSHQHHGHSHSHAHTNVPHTNGHSHGATGANVGVDGDGVVDYYIDDEHALTANVPDVAVNPVANGLKRQQQQPGHKEHNEHNDDFASLGKGAEGAATEPRNLNVRAALIHVIGDLVQSVGVFLAAVFIHFNPSAKYVDPLCTLLFSIIVVLTTVRLFRESMRVLLDSVPPGVSLLQLENDLLHIAGVKSVHHLNVWQHTSNHSVLMAHLIIDFLSDSNTVLKHATQLASSPKYQIKHCTIQIERTTP